MLIHLWEKLRFYLFGYEKFNKTVVWWIILHGYVTRYITTCVQFFVQIKYTRYITMYSLESFRGSRERSRRQKVSNGIPLSSRVTAKNKGRMFFRVAPVSCRIMLARRSLFAHVVALFSRGNRTAQTSHGSRGKTTTTLPILTFQFFSFSFFLPSFIVPFCSWKKKRILHNYLPNNFNSFPQNSIVSSLLFCASILFTNYK